MTSLDGGATWTSLAGTVGTSNWRGAAISADGKREFAGGAQGGIYTNGTGALVVKSASSIDLVYVGAGAYFLTGTSGNVIAP
jgi:hypothetical protein